MGEEYGVHVVVCACMYVNRYVRMYVCMFVCIYSYVYTQLYIHNYVLLSVSSTENEETFSIAPQPSAHVCV